MKISILCSSEEHPVNAWLNTWIKKQGQNHDIELVRKKSELTGGDLLFLISCSELIKEKERSLYGKVLVIHASDLPNGRGWSPHVWQIIEGKTILTVSLLEAIDRVDAGDIWHQINIINPEHALYNECNQLLFDAEIELMDFAVANFYCVRPCPQIEHDNMVYYPKRNPEDSRIDPKLSIAEQFNLMRICDTDRFPAFFELYGYRYMIKLEKINNEQIN